jgi:hypothetical protein
MTTLRNASRRRRPGSVGGRDDRMTIDYTRFYIFIGVVAILVLAVILNLYFNVLDEDEEKTYTDTVTINCYNDNHRVVPNGTTEFVFVVENNAGSDKDNFVTLEISERPNGWQAYFKQQVLKIGKESRALAFLTVVGPEGVEDDTFPFKVKAKSTTFEGESVAEVYVNPEPMTDNRTVESKDHLFVNYVGYLEDGRIFDTSVEKVAYSDVPKADDFSVRGEGQYSQFDFTHDNEPRDVIPGFDAGVAGMMVDQTKVITVPPSEGYTQEGHALYGKTLYFELSLEDIDRN